MSHWAQVDENNIVTMVTVGDDNDPNGDEGYRWLVENVGGRWIKTSRSGSIRKNFASPGHTYSEDLDAFIPPKMHESWVLNEETALWEAPTPKPEPFNHYWDEAALSWVEAPQ